MLGYIKAYKPELRLKEFEMYKAVYCSLCKIMGKKYGFLTRFTLSYDFTFLSLLNMSLSESVGTTERAPCVCNPLKKCTYCKGSDNYLLMPAAASVIMVYYNILDNVADEKGIKRLSYKLLSYLFKSAHNKAKSDFPEIESAVCEYIEAQNHLEKTGCTDMDVAAQPTSNVLSRIFMMCSDNDSDRRALERLGFCLGRFIYLADALADFEEDTKHKRFNPLQNYNDSKERAERNIYMCINEAINAFELINIRQYKNILGNIIYMGLEDTFKRSLSNERSV